MKKNILIVKSIGVFFTVFLCLMLTKAYTHLVPDLITDIFIFGIKITGWGVKIIPALFSFPISFLCGLLSYVMLEKAEKLSILNKNIMEMNEALEKEIKEKTIIQKSLEESEQRFREMAELLPSAICEIDLELNVTYANELGLKMFEIEKEELERGFNGLCLIHPDELSVTSERISRLINGESIDTIETRMCTKNGKTLNVLRNTNAIRRDGKTAGLRLCITDITEQKAMQKELMHSNRMKSVAILAGGIAHKFNNLLNIITGNLELMQLEHENEPSLLRNIPPAFDAARQMVKLTDLLLNYSKGGQLNLGSVDINFMIEKLLLRLNSKTPESVKLIFEKPENKISAEADKMLLETVIESVIQNSIEAIEEKGQITVEIEEMTSSEDIKFRHPEAEPNKKYISVKIKDNGKGMNQQTIDSLFDPFYSTKFPGRGLGMAAAYGIITAHGGWIEAKSKLGEGACITVFIPSENNNAPI